MKKQISTILTAAALLSMLPLGVSAASDPVKEQFFPSGELMPFPKSYIKIESEYSHSTQLSVYTPVPSDMSSFVNYFDTEENAAEKLGLYEYIIFYQSDLAIDDPNAWRSQPEWNWDTPTDFVDYGAYADATVCEAYSDARIIVASQLDLYWEETREQLEGCCYAGEEQEDGSIPYFLDLENHTYYFRQRAVLCYQYANESGEAGEEWQYLYAPWSEAASIGKNGTQKELVEPTSIDAPIISNLVIVPPDKYGDQAHLRYDVKITQNILDAWMWYNIYGNWTDIGALYGEINVNNTGWQDIYIGNAYDVISEGERISSTSEALTKESYVQFRLRIDGEYLTSDWSNILEVNAPTWESSAWAEEELMQASSLGLIPDCLKNADLTKHITRAEFAAVCVKTYEALSGTAAIPATVNPFTDTTDPEVLKAYEINAVNGTSATTYHPGNLLTREQMATMLTRVYKRVTLNGWTLATDAQFKLEYEKPEPFADDADISGYARDSVYFMASHKIINGVGDNNFAPRNSTPTQEAINYAQATREQALVIAARMVSKLGN